MLYSSVLLALASSAHAISTGFNYGATNTDGSAKTRQNFENEFNTAKKLVGTDGAFTSARLYTTIQPGSQNSPIEAIQAAIDTKTTLLLGMWASGGEAGFTNEIAALNNAITAYGSKFTDLVVGLSVGSEDLYRNSVMGVQASAGVGVGPDVIVNYIGQVRKALANTVLDNVPIGHVDTWTAYVNGSNNAVVEACDWVGMDAYPYFQNTMANSIESGSDLFFEALSNTTSAANGKPVWITETGWPVSGKTENLGIPSVDNAESYWKQVACKILPTTNTWWYTLQDASPSTPNPSFGLVGSTLTTDPLYDLSCDGVSSSSSSSSASSSKTSSAGSSSATGSASATSGSSSSAATASGSASSVSVNTSMATLKPATSSLTATVTGAPVAPSSVSTTHTASAPQATGAASSSRAMNFAAAVFGIVAAGAVVF